MGVAEHEKATERRAQLGEKTPEGVILERVPAQEEDQGEKPLDRDSARKAKKDITVTEVEEKKSDAQLDAMIERLTQKGVAASGYKTEVDEKIIMMDLTNLNGTNGNKRRSCTTCDE